MPTIDEHRDYLTANHYELLGTVSDYDEYYVRPADLRLAHIVILPQSVHLFIESVEQPAVLGLLFTMYAQTDAGEARSQRARDHYRRLFPQAYPESSSTRNLTTSPTS